jgi:hypothetical protein
LHISSNFLISSSALVVAAVGALSGWRVCAEIGVVNHVHRIVRFGASKRKNRELIVRGEVALRSVSVQIAELVQTSETTVGQIFFEIR